MIIVSDTSVITNLMNIQHLLLLKQLYKQVVIPQSVYEKLSIVENIEQDCFCCVFCFGIG